MQNRNNENEKTSKNEVKQGIEDRNDKEVRKRTVI